MPTAPLSPKEGTQLAGCSHMSWPQRAHPWQVPTQKRWPSSKAIPSLFCEKRPLPCHAGTFDGICHHHLSASDSLHRLSRVLGKLTSTGLPNDESRDGVSTRLVSCCPSFADGSEDVRAPSSSDAISFISCPWSFPLSPSFDFGCHSRLASLCPTRGR